MLLTLRPYQEKVEAGIRDCYRRRVRRVLLVMPCGSGKTVVFSKIAHGALKKEKSVVIVAHRKELITQCSDKLTRFGVDHGIIKAGFEPSYNLPIQVASVQTLEKRLDKIAPNMLTADEAHHSQATIWQKVIDAFPDAILLGVTASPIFGNGRTLGGFYDAIVIGPTVRELIDDGYLVDTRVFAPPPVCDLSSVSMTGGDYNKGELDEAMRKRSITGDAIGHYQRIAPGLPAIATVVSIKHGQEVAEQFREAGFSFYGIDGSMKDDQRDGLLRAHARGEIQGLVSCDLISEGTDIPTAQVMIKLRPTHSLGLNIQHDGRVNRPLYAAGFDLETRESRLAAIAASAKPCAYIIDHVNNLHFHGYPDDVWEWSLTEKPRRGGAGGSTVPMCQCAKCYMRFRPRPVCPFCGDERPINERPLIYTEGELKEMKRADAAAAKIAEATLKAKKERERKAAKTLPELIAFAKKYNYDNPEGWARNFMNVRQKYRGGR